MGKPIPFPRISAWLLWVVFAALALTLFVVRAVVWPEVPMDPGTNALNYCSGLLLGFAIHRTYVQEEG